MVGLSPTVRCALIHRGLQKTPIVINPLLINSPNVTESLPVWFMISTARPLILVLGQGNMPKYYISVPQVRSCTITATSYERHDVSNHRFLVFSTACSCKQQRKYQGSASLILCERHLPLTGGFPWQRASNMESVSMPCHPHHYDDVIKGAMASQITSLTIVYSTVYSGADQSKHQSSASLAFVWGIHRGPVNSPHKWPVTRKMFPFDDVIMRWHLFIRAQSWCKNLFSEPFSSLYDTTLHFVNMWKPFPLIQHVQKKNETNGGCDHRCFQQCTYMHNHRHKNICAHIHMYVCVWTETYIHRVGWYFVTNWRIIYRSSLTKIYFQCKPNFLRQEYIQASIYHQEFHVTSMSANATALLCCIMTTFSIHVSLIVLVAFLAKNGCYTPIEDNKTNVDRTFVFPLGCISSEIPWERYLWPVVVRAS